MKKKNYLPVFIFGALFISAMTALAIDHARSTIFCHDVRLYMDGSYDAKIEKGGLTPRVDLTLYRLTNLKNVKIQSEPATVVPQLIDGTRGELYSSQHIRFFIPFTDKSLSNAPNAQVDADLAHEKIHANLKCESHS